RPQRRPAWAPRPTFRPRPRRRPKPRNSLSPRAASPSPLPTPARIEGRRAIAALLFLRECGDRGQTVRCGAEICWAAQGEVARVVPFAPLLPQLRRAVGTTIVKHG